MTSSGMELATFQFVAQHLNHCATAVPLFATLSHSILLGIRNVSDKVVEKIKTHILFYGMTNRCDNVQ